jgi:DNA-binding transcriptional ArsR family regulator
LSGQLDLVFGAVADPTRRAILSSLRRGPASITALAEPFDMSFAAVSKHVLVLERAGLIRREIVGREHHCHLAPEPFEGASDWLERYRDFWESRLEALKEHLEGGRKRSRRRR